MMQGSTGASLLWKAEREGNAQGDLTTVYTHLMVEGGKGNRVRLFSVVPRDRTSGKIHLLFHGKIDSALAQVAQRSSGTVVSGDSKKSVDTVLGNISR